MQFAINIKTSDGHYLQADNGGGGELTAKGPWAKEWETFWVAPVTGPTSQLQHGQVITLRTLTGQGVVVIPPDPRVSMIPKVKCLTGKATEFTLVVPAVNQHLAIVNGSPFSLQFPLPVGYGFVGAESGGGSGVYAGLSSSGDFETFYAEFPEQPPLFVSLRASDGEHYLQAPNGGGDELTAKGPWAKEWETFEVLRGDPMPPGEYRSGVHLHLRTYNGHFVQAPDATGHVTALAKNCSDRKMTWFLPEIHSPCRNLENGAKISLRTFDGHYVRAEGGGGGAVTAPSGKADTYETFTAEVHRGNRTTHPDTIRPDWILIRDQIHINDELLQMIREDASAGKIPVGGTVLLAAREIDHEPGGYAWKVPEYNLVIVGDNYSPNGGSLDLSPITPDANPTTGKQGEKGEAQPYYGKKGGPGGSGSPGTDGFACDRSVRILCQTVANLKIVCNGGVGGTGGKGGRGGDGADAVDTPLVGGGGGWPYWGSSGGDGGTGGSGGKGGDGGRVEVYFTNGDVGTISTKAGNGGEGGKGGDPGTGTPGDVIEVDGYKPGYSWTGSWHHTHDGAVGRQGCTGAPGAEGHSLSTRIDLSEWRDRVRIWLGPVTATWAEYRIRVGEYLHRCFVPAQSADSNGGHREKYYKPAVNEAESAFLLCPESAAAQMLRDRLRLNKTPIDIARDCDVSQDFEEYDDIITKHYPFVSQLFNGVQSLLDNAANIGIANSTLNLEIGRATDYQTVAKDENLAAADAQQLAQKDVDDIIKKADEVTKQIETQKSLLQNHRIQVQSGLSWDDLGTIVDVGTILVGICTGIGGVWTALAASTDLIVRVGNDIESSFWAGDATLGSDLSKTAGGLKDLVKQSKDLISAAKSLYDLANAKLNGPGTADEQKKMKDLIAKALDLAIQRTQAELRLSQARHLTDATVAKKDATQHDIERIRTEQQNLTNDGSIYAAVIPSLLRVACQYGDVLLKQVFLAARAVDIYRACPQSDAECVSFDCGFVHPDDEERALDSMRRGNNRGIARLISGYLMSWQSAPQIVTFANDYNQYNNLLESQFQFFNPLADPELLQTFIGSAALQFCIPQDWLLSGRSEAKVESVRIALLGATSAKPAFMVQLKHSGHSWILRQDGSSVETFDPPRRATLQGVTAPATGSDTNAESLTAKYWGRSPIAEWELWIEPDVITSNSLDLSGLTGIEMRIGYRAKVVAAHIIRPFAVVSIRSDERDIA